MSTPVNIHLLDALLYPLGTADSDEDIAEFADLNTDNEAAVREMIRHRIKSFYDAWGPESRTIGKSSLAYWLSFKSKDLEALYNTNMLALSPRGPWQHQKAWTERFFVLMWEELFGDEDYHLSNPNAYEIRNDAIGSNRVIKE